MTNEDKQAYQEAGEIMARLIGEHLLRSDINPERKAWSVYQPLSNGNSLVVRHAKEEGTFQLQHAIGGSTLFLPERNRPFPANDFANREHTENIIAEDLELAIQLARNSGFDVDHDEFRVVRPYHGGTSVVIIFIGEGEDRQVKVDVKELTFVLDEVDEAVLLGKK